jgi:hypothetical protein
VQSPEQGIRIGRPIGNTQVHVLDGRGRPCPIGVAGELFIGGDGVALGYLRRPELTAERFVADPFSTQPGARLYRTGDRGRWCHDGRLEHLGRLDFQVKVRGHRIELGEIEAALASHAQVARAVVIVREDRPGDVRLVAYVVGRSGEAGAAGQTGAGVDAGGVDAGGGDAGGHAAPHAAPAATVLREHLRSTLPEYMVPQHFVAIEAVPLLPNGKMDRSALPVPQAEPGSQRLAARDAPQTEAEKAVAAVWQELLGIEAVGRSDNFFDLGGHSLLAMRAVHEMATRAGIQLELRRLVFESLAQVSAQGGSQDAVPAQARELPSEPRAGAAQGVRPPPAAEPRSEPVEVASGRNGLLDRLLDSIGLGR